MTTRAGLALTWLLALVVVQPSTAGDAAVDDVSLFADSTVLEAQQRVRLHGTISSRERGELVELEVQDCGQPSFRGVAGTTTEHGGEWSLEYWPGVGTTIRATWRNDRSIEIPLRQRALVELFKKRSSGELAVWILGKTHFWRKHVLLQRRTSGAWKTVRKIVLTEQIAVTGFGAVRTGAVLRARVPRGSLVRAVLPRSQAAPCYLAGVSKEVRT